MKPSCEICGQVVLVSKQRSTESEGKHWHNDCMALERERVAMEKLVGLCRGDVELAKSIRSHLLGTPGGLTLWKRNR